MSVKILLADDSPTVHKVIKIILKDEPYEIIECAQEERLNELLKSQKPHMVFLDFNFSDKHSGYELASNIKKHAPETKILVMYGTFDTVDEGLLKSSQVEQFVVKPFDTAKFKVQVRSLAEGDLQEYSSEVSHDDSWTIKEEKSLPQQSQKITSIEDDLGDWGMAIPGIIGETSGAVELPPVIESSHSLIENELKLPDPIAPKVESKSKEIALPTESDLEYPDMSDLSSSALDDISSSDLELAPSGKTSSKLISLDDLSLDEPESLDTSALLELSQMDDDENIQKIEEQIRDEVEADLWSVDSIEEASPRLSVVKEEESLDFSSYSDGPKVETMDGGQSFDENLFARIDANESRSDYVPTAKVEMKAEKKSSQSIDIDELRPLMKEMINQAVAEYCRQHIDKVAWEVIPDLAENLIKQELKKISDKVSRDL